MKSLLLKSGVELARMVREGEVSSCELVDVHIERIEEVNGVLNAVVAQRFSEARKEASLVDKRLSEGEVVDPVKQPFLGVPCTIKECFQLEGMPHTSGLVARKGIVSSQDATAVTRLKRAGAIPLAVTNISELCMWMESNNKVYGRTNNPYHPGHIVGGSSGGEGAIVGAGGSPFGLGSDVGGSIRMPAFFNGVFGHKPSGGLVPGTGQFPFPEGKSLRYLSTGPICRRAEDLMPALKAMAGPDGFDEGCTPMELGDPSQVDLSSLIVLDIPSNDRQPVSSELQLSQVRVVRHLRSLGASIQRRSFTSLRQSLEIWGAMLGDAQKEPVFRTLLEREKTSDLLKQFVLWCFRRSPHTLPAIVLGLFENIGELNPALTAKFVAQGEALKRELIEAMGPHGILLFPSYVSTAPRHYKPMFPSFNWVYTAIFNVLQFAVTQVPLGLSAHGLPMGIQVASAPGNDHLTIAVALELERAFGGWFPPRSERIHM